MTSLDPSDKGKPVGVPASPSGHSAEPEPCSTVSAAGAASVPNAVRRTISSWDTAPLNGSPFHILNTIRFNPLASRWEVLCRDEGDTRKWHPMDMAGNSPSMWLRLVPLPYEVPTSFAFTLTYEVRRKTWGERIFDRLFKLQSVDFFRLFASAMSAFGQDRGTGLEAKPASAVGEAETPTPKSKSQGQVP